MSTLRVIKQARCRFSYTWSLSLIIVWVLAVFVLTSCHAMNANRLHIRIQNASAEDISDFWLGAGSGAGGPGSRSFGAITSGNTTPYRSLKAEFGLYSNYNFLTTDNQRFIGTSFPNDMFGKVELEPGYYTFVVSTDGNATSLEIVHDPAP